MVGGEEQAREVWKLLQNKYTRRLKAAGRELVQKFVLYKMGNDTTIDQAWSYLSDLGREISVTHPGKGYEKSEERIQQLLSALPREYRFVRQTIDASEMDTDEILLRLKEEERIMAQDNDKDVALAATQGRRPQYQRSGDTRSNCLLCDSPDHRVSHCSFLRDAQKLVKSKLERVQGKRSASRRNSSPNKDLRSLVKQLSIEVEALKKGSKRNKAKAFVSKDPDQSQSLSSGSELPSDQEEVDEIAQAARNARGKLPPSQWLLDSGASNHMTDQLSVFRGSLKEIPRRWVKVGGGYLHADQAGDAVVQDQEGNETVLFALFVPALGVNLVSGRKLCSDYKLKGLMDDDSFTLIDQSFKPVLFCTVKGGVYIVKTILDRMRINSDATQQAHAAGEAGAGFSAKETPQDLSDKKIAEYQLWHRRFCHLGAEKLRSLHKVTTLDKPIPIASEEHCPCEVCSLTKIRRMRGRPTQRKASPLALVSIDLCGPFEISRLGYRYFLLIVDNYSRKAWSYPLKAKNDSQNFLRAWKLKVELQISLKLQAVRSDQAPELLELLREWEKEFGIAMNPTEAYNSLQNGVAERGIQSSENDMRAMLKDSLMPNEFWPEALEAGIYLRNRTASGPEVDGERISPEEAFSGARPSIDHVHVWGCKVYSYMSPSSLPKESSKDKLMDRGRVGVFMGYVEDTTKQWKIWAPDMRKIILSSNVKFCEHEKGGEMQLGIPILTTPNSAPARNPRGRPKTDPQPEPKVVQTRIFSHVEIPVQKRPEPTDHHNEESLGSKEATQDKPLQEESPLPSQGNKRRREDEEEDPDAPQAKVLRAFQALVDKMDLSLDQKETVEWAMNSTFLSPYSRMEWALEAVGEEVTQPYTYHDAINDPQWGERWKEAIHREITALVANGTWEEVVPPKGANLVTSRWVFVVKRNTDHSIASFKARLVARGFSQKYGVDYTDTFAPTVRHDTLRTFFAVVCLEDLECHQVDVNNAFTESSLKEDIYMKPPPGVDVRPGRALHILKSLYGLKQAARDWHQLCVSELKEMGFIQSEADPCLLTCPSKQLMILVYVDDITIAGKDIENVLWFKDSLSKVFKIKDLGEVNKVLGVRVVRNREKGTLRLDQTHYVEDVLDRLHMAKEKAQPTHSPLDSYDSLKPAGPNDFRVNQQEYQQGVGSWMYLGILTRPDISFALGRLSQYLADPAAFHLSALKKLGRYVRSSKDLGILYTKQGNKTLEGYSDSDFAMDKTDRVSILGNVFTLAGGPVSWMSKKQKSVATSTMEAEYMGMCACAKQSQWLAQILRDMGMHHLVGQNPFKPVVKEKMGFMIGSPTTGCVNLKGDNQAALALIKDAHTHERSKHIDIAFHYVRMLWQKRRISVEFVGTSDMVADGLTKPKSGPAFQRFVNQLGLVED